MRVQIVEVHLFQAVGRHFAVDVGSRKRNPNKFTEVKVWCCSEGPVVGFSLSSLRLLVFSFVNFQFVSWLSEQQCFQRAF